MMKGNKMILGPRFVILGGFLGAGKTTTVLQLAGSFHLHPSYATDAALELGDVQSLLLGIS
ncbi:MAG: hypothetical protein R3F19_35025 [Verrucomicrobiales bacterium]